MTLTRMSWYKASTSESLLRSNCRYFSRFSTFCRGHAPGNPAAYGSGPIFKEVHAGCRAQEQADFAEDVAAFLRRFGRPNGLRHCNIGMAAQPGELRRDLFGRQHKVHAPGRDGAHGHPGMPGRFFILHEGQAAFRLDGLQSPSAIRSGSGQDDANCRALPLIGKRTEKAIDGQVPPGKCPSVWQAAKCLVGWSCRR